MINPTTVSMIRDIVAIFGVIAGFTYYVLTVQNTRKNQQLQLETRQAQLFMQIFQEFSSVDNFRVMNDIQKMEWEDYDDFMRKYSGDVSQDAFAKRYSIQYRFDGIGLLVKEGLIDLERVHDLMWTFIANVWDKYGDINIKHREVHNNPTFMQGFEYLANELRKLRLEKGFSVYGPVKSRQQ
jgi:hypothetical protein